MHMDKWYRRFISVAELVATWSKDQSTQVGAAIFSPEKAVLAVGYNGMVRGMDDALLAYHERPLKYALFEHAERNAIYNAAQHGIRLEGMGLACTWFPCADCARAIVQSGLKTLVYHPIQMEPEKLARWEESWNAAQLILFAGGVEVHKVPREEAKN